MSRLVIPWCTYTDPEVAQVGRSPADAEGRGGAVTAYTTQLAEVDRAVAEDDDDGFVMVHVRAGSDEIVGATVVARNAGEIINEITGAVVAGVGLGALASVIHPYPTVAEAVRSMADAYNRTRLTPLRAALLRRYLTWRR